MSRGTKIPKIDPRQIVLPVIDPDARHWLPAKELGAHFLKDQDTIYLWRSEGVIPELIRDPLSGRNRRMVRRAGLKQLLFHIDLVPILEEKFAQSLD